MNTAETGNQNNQSGAETVEATRIKQDQTPTNLWNITAYIGPLVLVSYFMNREQRTESLTFHTKQGIILFVIEMAVWIISMIMPLLFPILTLINLLMLVLSIIGVVNALRSREKILPLVGKFANHFSI